MNKLTGLDRLQGVQRVNEWDDIDHVEEAQNPLDAEMFVDLIHSLLSLCVCALVQHTHTHTAAQWEVVLGTSGL